MSESEKQTVAPKMSWFTGLKQEFRKIIWPSKESLGKQTMAVILVSVVLGLVIAGVDVLAQHGVNILVNF